MLESTSTGSRRRVIDLPNGHHVSPDQTSWRSLGSSPADRTMARGKKSEVRDHAAVQVLVFQRAGVGTSLVGGRLFGLGVLGFDVAVLATFGLPPGAARAVQLVLAIRMLTVALVVTTRPVFACAPVAQTDPRARTAPAARSRLATAISRTLASAHGRFDLPRESPGRVCNHSPRALSKREPRQCSRYSSAALNQTKSETTLEMRLRTRHLDQ